MVQEGDESAGCNSWVKEENVTKKKRRAREML